MIRRMKSQMSGSKGQGSAKKDKDGNANKNKEVDTTRHQEALQVRDVDEDDEEGYADDEGGGNRPEQPSRVAYIKGQGKKPPRTCNLVHVPYRRNRAPFGFMRLVPCLQCRESGFQS